MIPNLTQCKSMPPETVRPIFSLFGFPFATRNRKSKTFFFAYCLTLTLAFLVSAAFTILNPSFLSSPWPQNSSSRSQLFFLFSLFLPNSTQPSRFGDKLQGQPQHPMESSQPSLAQASGGGLNENAINSDGNKRSRNNGSSNELLRNHKEEGWVEQMSHCSIFDGRWVSHESYPLYQAGSCPYVDEAFNCFVNGRPDTSYAKYRWQPNGCSIPRLDGKHMLELLRGKRLVYIGDSVNRNMWESLVCILHNSIENQSRIFEASGRVEFHSEGSYSFIFKDYNCSIEFFRSNFLVQEGEATDLKGKKKETLHLDVMEQTFQRYKTADVLIFNTGHWYTHEKTSKGEGYYQEGGVIHEHLNPKVAMKKALMTWGKWIDANIDPAKTLVFFSGLSSSHFRGGRWNSGGMCNGETEPIWNAKYLKKYPSKMRNFEAVMRGIKTPVLYLNITRMTGFRKDGHPSIYGEKKVRGEERGSRLRFQDCSHWCLPGVPDIWNELVYAQLLLKAKQQRMAEQEKH